MSKRSLDNEGRIERTKGKLALEKRTASHYEVVVPMQRKRKKQEKAVSHSFFRIFRVNLMQVYDNTSLVRTKNHYFRRMLFYG